MANLRVFSSDLLFFSRDFAVNLGHLGIYLANSQKNCPKMTNFRVFSGDLFIFFNYNGQNPPLYILPGIKVVVLLVFGPIHFFHNKKK